MEREEIFSKLNEIDNKVELDNFLYDNNLGFFFFYTNKIKLQSQLIQQNYNYNNNNCNYTIFSMFYLICY